MPALGISDADLASAKGMWTAREINQQPAMILETHQILSDMQSEIEGFLEPMIGKKDTRIILIGAGTSAFIGECLAPILSAKLKLRCEAVATTDIVSAPHYYLEADADTLVVSFGRSGPSPASVAAVNIINAYVSTARHIFITCNADGELMKMSKSTSNALAVLLPEKTHDKSFAMTSSFTSMLFAALSIFETVPAMRGRVEAIAEGVQSVLDQYSFMLRSLAREGFERVVYLGSHGFKGLAQESALKLLELTDGNTVALHDTPMGFRHGPKTIVNDKTLVVVFVSNDPYTRKYDLDLLSELIADDIARVVAISTEPLKEMEDRKAIVLPDMAQAYDQDLLIPYMVAPQILAFYQSMELGHTPDNPNPEGRVNRVVQGVKIHAAQ